MLIRRGRQFLKMINLEKFFKKINWRPHDAQMKVLEAFNDPSVRDIVLAGGTRFGKSNLCGALALMELLKDNKRIWLISPSYDLAGKVFRYIEEFIATGFPESDIRVSRRVPQSITTKWGSVLECKSTENLTALLGEELDLAIMDECSRAPQEAWDSYVRQRLTSRQGRSIKISTPRGQNWFWREWKRVNESADGKAFRFSSKDNPYFPIKEWEREKKGLPEKIFQQEYEASFLPESAGIFTNISDCISGEFEEYNEKHLYTMGVDLGRYEDFTVITVMDRMTNHLVHFNRFNIIDWSAQKRIITETADKYGNPSMFIDATSITVGDAYVNELADAGYNVFGYKINSNISKRQLVEKTVAMVNQKQITYPETEDLIDELQAYTYKISDGGIIKYEAPYGMHDDGVISLCLACWDLDSEPLSETEGYGSDILRFPIPEY
jgi:hypothetical protein